MKHIFGVLVLTLLLPATARAQVFYTYPGAPVTERNRLVYGPYLGVGDEELVRFSGFARFGMTTDIDGGIELLVQTLSNHTMVGGATDLKLRVFPATPALPFDLSLNGGIGFVSGDNLSILQVPIGTVASAPFELDSGRIVVPYVAVYLLIVRSTFDRGRLPDLTDTDVDVELRTGMRFPVAAKMDLFGAIHLGRDATVTLGLNVRM